MGATRRHIVILMRPCRHRLSLKSSLYSAATKPIETTLLSPYTHGISTVAALAEGNIPDNRS